jgi:hypothetical protein
MAMPHDRLPRRGERRPTTASRRSLLAVLLAALLPPPASSEAKRHGARGGRQQSTPETTKAKKRVNACMRHAPPQICHCDPWASALCRQCWEAVSGCCSQMRISRVAGCTCLYTTGWGSCVR